MELDIERCAYCHRVIVGDSCPVCVRGTDSVRPRGRSDHPSAAPPSIHPASLHPSARPASMHPSARPASMHPPSMHPDGRPKSIAPAFAALRPPSAERSPWWGRGAGLLLLSMVLALGWARCGDRPAWRPLAMDVEGPKPDTAKSVLFFLHGYGGNNTDVEWIAPPLRAAGLSPDMSIVFLQGPYATGWGRHWGDDGTARRGARDRAREAIRIALGASTIAADHVFVAGFSQGAQVAAEIAAEEPRIGRVAMLSPCGGNAQPFPQGMKVFIASGSRDRTCKPEVSDELVERYEKEGAKVTFVPFEDGHVIAPVVIDGLASFVAKQTPKDDKL